MSSGWPGKRPMARIRVANAQQYPRNQQAASNIPGNAEQQGDAAAPGALFFSGIQQHDDEDEQHHDRARVNDDLHRGHKLRAQQQIFPRERPPSPPPATTRC